MDLIERIHSWGQLYPNRIAHVSGRQALTYQELSEQSNKVAHYLKRMIPSDCSPVAIQGHKQAEMTVGFIGCIKAGHPYIPLESSLPEQRKNLVLETAKAALVLTADTIREIVNAEPVAANFEFARPRPNDPWYILFTSGSTGNPKGVVITRENIENFLAWSLGEQRFREAREIFLDQPPFSFDVSVMGLYGALSTAGTFVGITNEEIGEPRLLYKAISDSRCTIFVSTPSFARLCLMNKSFSAEMVPEVRSFWLCGETLAPEVASDLLQRFPTAEVWNAYGPTEATVATSTLKITEEVIAKYSPLPIGTAMPGTQLPIHDPEGKPVPDGQRGEIIIAGPNVSIGYLNRPDLTARAFFELDGQRAYHTGDWGHYRDGLLFFDGRIDFQIKFHGYRIEIGDIEANLHVLQNVQDAVVIPIMKNDQVDYLVTFVILKNRPAATDFEIMRELKRQLSERVPDYMVPRKFVFREEFPTTTNGKVDRRKLVESLP